MGPVSAELPTVAGVRGVLLYVAVTEDVAPMRSYMRDQFDFLGVKSAARRKAVGSLVRPLRSADGAEVLAFAAQCWAAPEREIQYVAADVLVANAGRLGLDDLPTIVDLVLSKSWWDTVDVLGPRVVGSIVKDEPDGWATVDRWIDEDEMWLARCAILQQLHYREDTDADVLFGRCRRRADDPEFFIRKAIGWALRQYARFDPDAVRRFVEDHRSGLSTLSVREATKHL